MGDFFGGGGETSVTVEQPIPPSAPPPRFEPPPPPEFNFEPPQPQPLDPAFSDYAKKAIAGELPVPVALEQDIARQQGVLIQALARSQGADWQTSTIGVQAMAEFNSRAEAMRDQARHGNAATTNTLLQGLIQQNAESNRAALAAFQEQLQAGMEAYQAQLEAALANYKAQYGQPTGVQRTTTTKGSGGGGGFGQLAGGVLGIGAASLLGAKKPWWMPDSETTGGTASGVISPGFGNQGYSLTGDYTGSTLETGQGGYNLGGVGGFNIGDIASGVDYGGGDLGFGNMFDPGFDMGGATYGGFDTGWAQDIAALQNPWAGWDAGSWWDPGAFSLNLPSFDFSGFDLGGFGGGFGGFDLGGFDLGGGFTPTLDLGSWA